MVKSNKNPFIKLISVFVILVFLVNFSSFVNAYTGNAPHDSNMMMTMSESESIPLSFDPNNYHFLVYNPGGYEPYIEDAMAKLGIPYTLRGDVNGVMVEVTPNDLSTHDILIVGWNFAGNIRDITSFEIYRYDNFLACDNSLALAYLILA